MLTDIHEKEEDISRQLMTGLPDWASGNTLISILFNNKLFELNIITCTNHRLWDNGVNTVNKSNRALLKEDGR